MEIINTEWGLNSYLELKSKRVFTDSEYREVLKPDVMFTKFQIMKSLTKANFGRQRRSQRKDNSECYKMKWHQMAVVVQLRLTVMIRVVNVFCARDT